MLTNKQIRTLNKARDILSALEKSCSAKRRETPENWAEADGFDFGRGAAAAATAEGALFNVLNTINAYRIQEIPDGLLHNREEVPA